MRPIVNIIEVGRLWEQRMDTCAMARVLRCKEYDVEKLLNRYLDKKEEGKNGG